MHELKIGDRLRIVDANTIFTDGVVAIVDIDKHKYVCSVVEQPDTDKFRRYRGGLFTLGSHVFVRNGQFILNDGTPNDGGPDSRDLGPSTKRATTTRGDA